MLWLSESGFPGFKDVQDLIDFLPDENKYNIPSFPIVGLNRLELDMLRFAMANATLRERYTQHDKTGSFILWLK